MKNSPFFDNQNNNNNANHNNTNNNASNNNTALPQIHTNVCSQHFLFCFFSIFLSFSEIPYFLYCFHHNLLSISIAHHFHPVLSYKPRNQLLTLNRIIHSFIN